LITGKTSVGSQVYKNLTSLGHNRGLSTLSNQGQNPPRRWLSSLGSIRPGITGPAISRSTFERFGISRRPIHHISRRGGQSSHLRNADARRAFCSENPRKKGEKFKPRENQRFALYYMKCWSWVSNWCSYCPMHSFGRKVYLHRAHYFANPILDAYATQRWPAARFSWVGVQPFLVLVPIQT